MPNPTYRLGDAWHGVHHTAPLFIPAKGFASKATEKLTDHMPKSFNSTVVVAGLVTLLAVSKRGDLERIIKRGWILVPPRGSRHRNLLTMTHRKSIILCVSLQ